MIPEKVLIRDPTLRKYAIGELASGDRIVGYDYDQKRVCEADIQSVEEVQGTVVRVALRQVGLVYWCQETRTLTPLGDMTVDQCERFLGYCYSNPRQLVVREAECVMPCKEQVKVYRVVWNGPRYIWAGGVLVGSDVCS